MAQQGLAGRQNSPEKGFNTVPSSENWGCLGVPELPQIQNGVKSQLGWLEHFHSATTQLWVENHINGFSQQSLHLESLCKSHLPLQTAISQYRSFLPIRETGHDLTFGEYLPIVSQVYDLSFGQRAGSSGTCRNG
jgi:hypothetical protein